MRPIPDLTIRDYRDGDAPALVALVRELQAHEGAIFDRMKPAGEIGEWYVDWLLSDCARHDGTIVIAELRGTAVGYASLMTRVDSSDDLDESYYEYAYVGDLVVSEAHRGSGIGRALLAECEARARRAGRQWLRISVLAANDVARAAYRHFGFRDHLVTMEKPLEPEGAHAT